jgi:hypothetical protein
MQPSGKLSRVLNAVQEELQIFGHLFLALLIRHHNNHVIGELIIDVLAEFGQFGLH